MVIHVCMCVHKSKIVTWLIHHGRSLFDYKRRGPMINCWLQLPGRSFDTRSQSICTATHPYRQRLAPVYPYSSETLMHPPVHAPNTLPTLFPSRTLPFALPSPPQLCIPCTLLTLVLSEAQPTSLCPHLQRGHISCSYISALCSALSPCFLFKPFLCNPELRNHQSFTVLILSPLSFAIFPTPARYDAPFVFFIYSTSDANFLKI